MNTLNEGALTQSSEVVSVGHSFDLRGSRGKMHDPLANGPDQQAKSRILAVHFKI